ncbi:hypothetical protein [Acidocella aminolytica]|uniref:hypothetical protein n=1 Tax=Acidocella aminolytica TaxID=33998 RepID=UPI00066278BB|nr:hypothetical protein [Acidocella aminolytica]
MKTSKSTKQNIQFPWQKRDANCFVRIGEAEVCRSKRGKPWVVLVPLVYENSSGNAWGLLQEGGKPQEFKNTHDAIVAAETYLHTFRQFHQLNEEDFVDLSGGNLRPAGSHG